jgi:hypothetical protein
LLSSEPPSHLRNAAEGGDGGWKIRSFPGEPEHPKVLHLASESTRQAIGEISTSAVYLAAKMFLACNSRYQFEIGK